MDTDSKLNWKSHFRHLNEKGHMKTEIEINEGKIQTQVQQQKTHVSNPTVERTVLPYPISMNAVKKFQYTNTMDW